MGSGKVKMIDIAGKDPSDREAVAGGRIRMKRSTKKKILSGVLKKGDVLSVARTAGIMAAKKTSDLLPLCHPLPINNVEVDIEPTERHLKVEVKVKYRGRTGVEMEALTGCTATLLTIYDMAKSQEKGMQIEGVKLLEKSGGKSGYWQSKE